MITEDSNTPHVLYTYVKCIDITVHRIELLKSQSFENLSNSIEILG